MHWNEKYDLICMFNARLMDNHLSLTIDLNALFNWVMNFFIKKNVFAICHSFATKESKALLFVACRVLLKGIHVTYKKYEHKINGNEKFDLNKRRPEPINTLLFLQNLVRILFDVFYYATLFDNTKKKKNSIKRPN